MHLIMSNLPFNPLSGDHFLESFTVSYPHTDILMNTHSPASYLPCKLLCIPLLVRSYQRLSGVI